MNNEYRAPPRRIGRLERPGCRLHYEVTGEGPAILFLHGLGGNQMSWWQQVAHFAPRWTCVTLAQRGFAPSSAIAGGPDPADFADDVAALVDHLGLADLRIVAQSMGGWAAVEFALLRTGKLRGLVLSATTGSIDQNKLREPERSKLAGWRATSAAKAAALLARGIRGSTGERMAREQPAATQLYRHLDEMNAALDKEALRRRLHAARTRAPEELAAAGCPVLLIGCGEDIVMPPFAAEAVAAVVPGARAAMLPESGHSGYFERPALFNQIVGEFLEPTR
jgi:pimeloyl-ACP methyl ester carboxylesterase